ncbi:nuclear envelope pore membrane protein POM 121 [Pseudorasbora parva]|uniref:nuclear envelope pore membrane protein POM 121 n=1 Tax=Pseudorasbora parva TaxID=51549 RepID=UPI00351F1FC9
MFPRRRGAVMSPEEKRRLVVFSAVLFSLFLLLFVLSYIPAYLYILFICVVSCVVYYHKAEELQLFERIGLNPRRGLSVPPALLRWLPGRTLSGVPVSGRNKIRKSDARNSFASPSDRYLTGSCYRREQTLSESAFSPRDILMGSYLAKPEERPGGPGLGQPREPLRERLSRPNHAALTPNRRLSFGDPVGSAGRFSITPHRHYPLQQPGASPVGLMPPVKWEGFRKKNILTQHNSPSPVTVKIARPDPARAALLDRMASPGAATSPGVAGRVDPCSREAVLSVLRESRKREVEEEEEEKKKSKRRRRHDSSESSQSAFEPLPNGSLSQLLPRPGSLKRGMNPSLTEECVMKRSRSSSISSISTAPVPGGVLGSIRNPIRSSYSSSQGYPQRRAASSLSLSPFTSPGGSRCQTPERAAKKAREEEVSSPSSASFVKMDKMAADPAPATTKLTPKSETPVSASDSGAGGGKRKRRIQLVTANRGDQISLPPPPELGYSITVKDLDMEKKAALSHIQKVLQEPEPETLPAASEAAPALSLFSQPSLTSSFGTTAVSSAPALASLSTPLLETRPAITTTSAPTIDLTISSASPAPLTSAPSISSAPLTSAPCITTPATLASSIPNPLLESLKSMKNNPLLTTPAAPAVCVSSVSTPVVSSNSSSGFVKSESGLAALQTPFSAPSSTATPDPKPAASMPSAFAQILAQPLHSSSTTPSGGGVGGGSLFSLIKPVASPASEPPPSTATVGSVNSVSISSSLSSGFKPIFGAASTTSTEVRTSQPTFKPIFGSTGTSISSFGPTATPASSAPASQNTGMIFAGRPDSQPASSAPASQTPSQALFGSWSAATTSAPATTFQFGAAPTTATPALNTNTASSGGSTSAFQFAGAKPAATQQAQNTFTFGQLSTNQNSSQNSTSSPFGQPSTNQKSNQNSTTAPSGFNSQNSTTAPSGFNSQNSTTAPSGFNSQNSTTAPSGFNSQNSTTAPSGFNSQNSTTAPSGFNSQNSTSTPFGQPSTNQNSTSGPFGQLKSSQNPPSGPFGQPSANQNSTSAPFGQSSTNQKSNQNSTSGPFGQPSANQNSTSATFGQSSTNQNVTSATFGQPCANQNSNQNSASGPFGQPSANQNSTPSPFGGFCSVTASEASTTQTTFGSSTFTASSAFPGSSQPKPFTFGSGGSGAAPFAFGGASSGFSFGNSSSAPPAAPAPAPAPAFSFGAAPSTAPSTPAPAPAPPASGGFSFGASLSASPFGTPAPAAPTPGFPFGANTDSKPAFGTSTPAFGQTPAGMQMPFGSPGTPGFGAMAASPFGAASPASFSIGTGSKSSGARRLQARRQHPRKK